MQCAWLFLGLIAIGCHKSEASLVDASPEAATASPCTWPNQRFANALASPDIQTLVRRCTGQTADAAKLTATAQFSNASVLAYVQTLDGDGGLRMVIALIESPATLTAWVTLPGSFSGSLVPGGSVPLTAAMQVRFESLRGETVIVEGLTAGSTGPFGTTNTITSERVWLKRGTALVDAGLYRLSDDETEREKGLGRSFIAKTIFHGDRVELREDVTWTWFTSTYSDMNGYERITTATARSTYEHGLTLRGDKLEPDTLTPEVAPLRPKATKP